ncbi:hypothetical protein JR316_0008458 [Psilocybe cubensis]|uniref:Uncharacterized protein n=2 Tax=Psilocybe cubensis TaxID=181762 RepID=A0ACB8GWH0_PSICU|nr:hypothetical protein JR316_0008458 [Psilocybe cubensis]KAH9479863.1 hypothetical protein JR316_0008458 [Psilocybe cubensis]
MKFASLLLATSVVFTSQVLASPTIQPGTPSGYQCSGPAGVTIPGSSVVTTLAPSDIDAAVPILMDSEAATQEKRDYVH